MRSGPPRAHARVRAECEAKRGIIAEHADPFYAEIGVCAVCAEGVGRLDGEHMAAPCRTLRFLALPYAGHADYQDTWRP